MIKKNDINQQKKINFKELKNKFLFIPLGGCDFIGTNCYLYHYDGKWIAIDCGIGFADKRETPGMNILIPDLTILSKYDIKLTALIITHSHEDHIGAISNLYKLLDCPIYTTTFGANFLEVDQLENNIKGKLKIHEIKTKKDKQFKIGPFEIEMIGLTHSMVEAHGIYIKTPVGSVFHTGDWKVDENPIIGEISDFKRLREISAEKGIDILICDSTNALKEGHVKSESLLEESLFEIVKKQKAMVVVATFASSISRLELVSRIAKKTHKKVVISGHSMHRTIGIAQKSGYLGNCEFFDAKDAKKFKREEIIVLATGCQGEYNASLAKLASNKHNFLKLQNGDTVIISAKTIPGNEIDVHNVTNNLIDKQIKVITGKDYFVHVSGHAQRDELKIMYENTNVKHLIPMHGDSLMFAEHVDFAKTCGLNSFIIPKNGIVIELSTKSIKDIGRIDTGYFGIDGSRYVHAKSTIIKERIDLSSNGVVFCNLFINNKDEMLKNPKISSFGIFDNNNKNDIEIVSNLEKKILSIIKPGFFKKKEYENDAQLKDKIKTIIRQDIHKTIGKMPLIEIIL